jgi:DNA (cytosine-5)-methyltransferase 1
VTWRSTETRRPLAVDLFSGAGGFAIGVEQAGFDVVAAVDYDPIHAAVHAFNFPETAVVCADARTLTVDALGVAAEEGRSRHGHQGVWDGQVDLVFGGPPCQGFSVIGKRGGDDTRNALSFAFGRIVRDLRPRAFILENVPGMRTASGLGGRPLLDHLIGRLRRAGYRVAAPLVLNAADFGVPQDRRRLLLVGVRSDLAAAPPRPPAPTCRPVAKRPSDPRRPAPRAGAPDGPTVRDAIGDLPNLDAYAELLDADRVILNPSVQARCLAASSPYARTMRDPWTDGDDLSYRRQLGPDTLTSSQRTVHAEDVAFRFAATATGAVEPISRFYRLHPDGLSATLRAGTGYDRGSFNAPRPVHYQLARVISVREAARLHSMPDWFRLHATKWHGFRQIGNAVPPLLARAVAVKLRDLLELPAVASTRTVRPGPQGLLCLAMREAAEHFNVPVTAGPHHGLRLRGPRTSSSLPSDAVA